MVSVDNSVQVCSTDWNGLHTVGEDSWRLLLEMFLNSQDICSKSRETYSWALMRYFGWLRMTGRRLSSLTPADIVGYKSYLLGRSLFSVFGNELSDIDRLANLHTHRRTETEETTVSYSHRNNIERCVGHQFLCLQWHYDRQS